MPQENSRASSWQMLIGSMRGKDLPWRDGTHKSINGLHKFRI
jgi:hypothetical protein